MIRTMLVDRKTSHARGGGDSASNEWANNPDLWVWADFDHEEPAHEREIFRAMFGLQNLVIDDARRERHPPKLEVFDEYFFLLIAGLDAVTSEIDFRTIRLAAFVSDRCMVTRRKSTSVGIDGAWADARTGSSILHVVPRMSPTASSGGSPTVTQPSSREWRAGWMPSRTRCSRTRTTNSWRR